MSDEQEADRPLIRYSPWVADESFGRHAGYALIDVYAGPRDPGRWARHVQVTVSPKGRSARVWVDGVEITAKTPAAAVQAPEDPEPPAGPETGVQGPLRPRSAGLADKPYPGQ